MRPKIALGLLAFALPVFGLAQTKLHVDFESSDLHKVWIADSLPAEPVEFKTASADIPVDSSLSKPTVWVENERTGNMASHDFATLGGKWAVKDADYVSVAEVAVRVESKGQPVASAELGVKGKGLDKHSLLTPGDKGQVVFYDVAPGTVNLTVGYKVGGKDVDPINQGFQIALERKVAQPVLIVSIPDAVDVVAPSPSPSSAATGSPSPAASGQPAAAPGTQPPAPGPGGGSIFGQAITIILVLGLVLGGAYFVMQMMKKNGDTVQDKLRQMGVDIPKAANDPADAVAAAPIQPLRQAGPPEKIVLGAATPDPVSMPATAAISLSGVPGLRMANGDLFELPEGETVVGRELGLGLSLINETTVSRRHATVTRHGSDIRVKDLGSSNGTYVNGAKVSGEVIAHSGDTVQFGSVQCRLEG